MISQTFVTKSDQFVFTIRNKPFALASHGAHTGFFLHRGPSFLRPVGLGAFSTPVVVVGTCLFFFPSERWLATCGVDSDLSQTRAAPQGLSRNTQEGTLIKKSGNEDKCFRGSWEKTSPWHSLQLLGALGREVVEAKGNTSPLLFISHGVERLHSPPGCSNSHLLTVCHAALQLTPGRCLAMLPRTTRLQRSF